MERITPGKWKDWEIAELLGKGAYGSVYLLKKNMQKAALKVIRIPEDQAEYERLLREYMSVEAMKEYFQDMAKRLGREIEIMMEIREQPNIVQIYDYEMLPEKNGYGFTLNILMEYLTPLPVYQEQHFMDEDDYIQMTIELASALEYCHAKKLIHRDIKPDNIFMTQNGIAKLGDFGMACYLDHNKRYMSIKGSTSYIAPEVFNGKAYDHRADLYSLALTVYRELNRGREPFVSVDKRLVSYAEKEEANRIRLAGERIAAPMDASIQLWRILKKALYADPSRRYDSISSMKKDLLRLQAGIFHYPRLNHRQYRKIMIVGSAGAGLIILGALILHYQSVNDRQAARRREEIREYTMEYDRKLQDIFSRNDFEAFSEDYQGYSESDFQMLRDQCYHDELKDTMYTDLADSSKAGKDGMKNVDLHYSEVLHYAVVGKYPDPESGVEACKLTYTICDDGKDVYLSTDDSDLFRTVLEKMPAGYRNAVAAGRNTENYAFANHWQDRDLVFDGVVGFDVTSLWQNEDRSLTVEVLVMNGTDETRVVNDMDYIFDDAQLGLIAEGNCGDEYKIAPGTSAAFEICIPAEEVQTGWQTWSDVEVTFSPNVD